MAQIKKGSAGRLRLSFLLGFQIFSGIFGGLRLEPNSAALDVVREIAEAKRRGI